jgi:hypothetical protein
MNFLTQVLHLVGSGAVAYVTARNLRDRQTRPHLLAGFQLAESGSVPLLETLSRRAADEGDRWLADRLAQHAQDEQRHGQIFAHALKQMNKQVIDFKNLPKATATSQPDQRRRSPFFDAYFEGYTAEDLKPDRMEWTVFMGSTYILELDASKDFVRMAHALPDTDTASANLKKGILSVASDETRHAAYLREAIERRLPYPKAIALMDDWRTRKVNAMLAMVGNLLQKNGQIPSMAQDGVPAEMSDNLYSSDSSSVVAAS